MYMVLQNSLSIMRDQGIGLENRWKSLIEKYASRLSFTPSGELLRTSTWIHGTKIGALHIPGMYKEHIPAILKLQGVKPNTSEVTMIKFFSKYNRSKIIRPPKIYEHFVWNEEDQIEIILFEKVEGQWAVPTKPAQQKDVEYFFSVYQDYKLNCLHTSWVEKPEKYSFEKWYERWRKGLKDIEENDKYASLIDFSLTKEAVDLLTKEIKVEDFEFMHGHLSYEDLLTTSHGDVVLFSNLMWGWHHPYYDAVFAYHWHMLGMQHVENLTPEMMKEERLKWREIYFSFKEVKEDPIRKRFLQIALLERAIAATLIDKYHLNFAKPQASIVIADRMEEVRELMNKITFSSRLKDL